LSNSSIDNSRSFPDSIEKCRLRLFQKLIIRAEGTGPSKMYRGSRLVILTPTTCKNFGALEYDIDQADVVKYEFFRGVDELPTICLKFDKQDRHLGKSFAS
jgi:hypothetical protein